MRKLDAESAALKLLNWADKTFPGSKKRILTRAEMGGLGQTETKQAWYEKIIDAAGQILPVYTQYQVQKDIVDLQVDRAKQGLPPLDPSQYTAAPLRIQHEVAPGAIAQGVAPETWTFLGLGAAILAGLLFLPRMMTGRKRRR